MNFIETIFKAYDKGIKQFNGEIPNDIRIFCIGSGSNFTIHKNITHVMADNLYKDYKAKLPLGTLIQKKENYPFILEEWYCMESNSGTTYTFKFEINEIIEHDPNDVIDEWIKTSKKRKEFINDLLSIFIKERKPKNKKN